MRLALGLDSFYTKKTLMSRNIKVSFINNFLHLLLPSTLQKNRNVLKMLCFSNFLNTVSQPSRA